MNVLKCIIADDEPIARQILENYITDVPNLELIASCKNAFEVMELMQQQEVDVLLLDINMPKLSGISLLKTMQKRPDVIITTAYAEYAIEGFELSVTDYLLKPFSLERFLQAIQKVQDKFSANPPSSNIASGTKASVNSIFVKSDKKLIKVALDQIYYVEAYGNYVKLYTDTMLLISQTLTSFLESLPANFVRIHKSFVINFNQLKLIEGNQVILQNQAKLPIGKSYKKDVMDRI